MKYNDDNWLRGRFVDTTNNKDDTSLFVLHPLIPKSTAIRLQIPALRYLIYAIINISSNIYANAVMYWWKPYPKDFTYSHQTTRYLSLPYYFCINQFL